MDLRNEKINYKIREHSVAKIPFIGVVGKKEAEDGSITLRKLGSKDQVTLPVDEAIKMLLAESQSP